MALSTESELFALWFAFKLVSLQDKRQLDMEKGESVGSCDLLSN